MRRTTVQHEIAWADKQSEQKLCKETYEQSNKHVRQTLQTWWKIGGLATHKIKVLDRAATYVGRWSEMLTSCHSWCKQCWRCCWASSTNRWQNPGCKQLELQLRSSSPSCWEQSLTHWEVDIGQSLKHKENSSERQFLPLNMGGWLKHLEITSQYN